MRKYEIMIIIDPDVDERQVPALLEKHQLVITAADGTVDSQDIWGKRRMAYEINKKPEGTYAVLNVTATVDAVKEMDRLMSIDEQIMRAKVMRTDKK
ncbi:30S ribosomal protein S6 [Brooklawnia sp.]|uniref:30S ribosomal protein S6 n=1 Tax=Brooklawnia sp. TaxID=2699740 RepID=UPI00311FA883